MTHDHDSDERKTRRLTDGQQFGWHPDAPTPTDYEQMMADVSSNDATPVSFDGPSLLGDSPADAPAYWTPGQPGELPPTIIRRKAPPSAQELLAKYSKPAMMALTVAAVSSAGMVQNTQNTLAQANNSSDSGDSPNVQAADTEQQPQLFQLLNDTDDGVRATAAGTGADRTEPFIYTVERGDWVRHIARDFGLQTMTVVWNNNLPDPDFILPGQQLLILPVDGVMIEVQPGDSLNSLATHYGVSATAIINYEPNGITNPDMIQPGQVLIVPGGAPPESATAAVSASSTETSTSTSTDTAATTQASASEPEPDPVQESAPAPQPEPEPEPAEEQTASFNGVGDTVVVESGDTLVEIASRHGVSVEEMASLNGLSDVDVIQPGDELYLPEGVEAQTAPDPEPQADPEPQPDLEPKPEPQTAPDPTPAPAPAPQPDPTPEPEPEPAPQPEPTAAPAPAPTTAPEPEPTAAPEPPPQSSGPPSGIEAQLEYYANQYGLDPNLIKAVAWRESGWNRSSVSSAGAIGVMQVMPGTATWINNNLVSRNLDVRGSTADNIEAGTAYLAHRIEQFGDVERGLAAYYMGPATVQNHGITATGRQYVDRILEIRDYFATNGSPPSWR